MQRNLLTATALLALMAVPPVLGQEEPADHRRDLGKRLIERRLEKSLLPTSAVPTSAVSTNTMSSGSLTGSSIKKSFINPRVEPGQVVWHNDYKEAVAASRDSGKPVLLFQMMGKLDDNFC